MVLLCRELWSCGVLKGEGAGRESSKLVRSFQLSPIAIRRSPLYQGPANKVRVLGLGFGVWGLGFGV